MTEDRAIVAWRCEPGYAAKRSAGTLLGDICDQWCSDKGLAISSLKTYEHIYACKLIVSLTDVKNI
jgi:hypothetical protein